MKTTVVPEGYHTVTPYLLVEGVDRLIDFVRRAFGAETLERVTRADGTVMHAEVRLGDSVIMMGEASEGFKPMPSSLYLYVEDVDRLYRQALDAGAESLMEPADQFYGDRMGGVKDPFGNLWWIAMHQEEVKGEELQRRSLEREG
jgi:PhnB protein